MKAAAAHGHVAVNSRELCGGGCGGKRAHGRRRADVLVSLLEDVVAATATALAASAAVAATAVASTAAALTTTASLAASCIGAEHRSELQDR